MADDVDRAQDYIELRLQDHIATARAAKPKFDWTGACFCGETEWEGESGPHFCGVFCRDLYEKTEKQKRIRGVGQEAEEEEV